MSADPEMLHVYADGKCIECGKKQPMQAVAEYCPVKMARRRAERDGK